MRCAVIYHSVTHHTEAMAKAIVEGMERVEGIEAKAFPVEAVDIPFVQDAMGIVFGCPVYFAGPSAALYSWFERTNHSLNLEGKLGGAFATEQYIHGGATDTIGEILRHLLSAGMLVYSGGRAWGKPYIHFGPVGVSPDIEPFHDLFAVYGERFAKETLKISR